MASNVRAMWPGLGRRSSQWEEESYGKWGYKSLTKELFKLSEVLSTQELYSVTARSGQRPSNSSLEGMGTKFSR